MSGAGLSLALCVAVVTLGEQARLARASRSASANLAFAAAYGLAALLATGMPAAGTLGAASAIVAILPAEACWRRGAGMWSAAAVVAAPYAALWATWAALRPGIWPPVLAGLSVAASRLSLGGPAPSGLAGHALIVLSAYVFCWGSATFLTRAALAGYADQLSSLAPNAAARAEAAAAVEPGLLRAGRLIGEFERVLTLTLTLTGAVAAVAFVVAAKALARFELARRHGEYFLVGTLCSIGLALLLGLLARQLLAV